jgi:hypothetical protein
VVGLGKDGVLGEDIVDREDWEVSFGESFGLDEEELDPLFLEKKPIFWIDTFGNWIDNDIGIEWSYWLDISKKSEVGGSWRWDVGSLGEMRTGGFKVDWVFRFLLSVRQCWFLG